MRYLYTLLALAVASAASACPPLLGGAYSSYAAPACAPAMTYSTPAPVILETPVRETVTVRETVQRQLLLYSAPAPVYGAPACDGRSFSYGTGSYGFARDYGYAARRFDARFYGTGFVGGTIVREERRGFLGNRSRTDIVAGPGAAVIHTEQRGLLGRVRSSTTIVR